MDKYRGRKVTLYKKIKGLNKTGLVIERTGFNVIILLKKDGGESFHEIERYISEVKINKQESLDVNYLFITRYLENCFQKRIRELEGSIRSLKEKVATLQEEARSCCKTYTTS